MKAHSKREFTSDTLRNFFRRQFLDDLCTSWGLDNRSNRRRKAAIAYDTFGEEQCRLWLEVADGNYREWERLTRNALRRTKKKRRKSASQKTKAGKLNKADLERIRRNRAYARQSAAVKQVAQFTNPHFGRGKVNARVRGIDPEVELATLRKQMNKAESHGDRASDFKRESLKQQIALLEAQIKSPKI